MSEDKLDEKNKAAGDHDREKAQTNCWALNMLLIKIMIFAFLKSIWRIKNQELFDNLDM